MPKSKKIDLKYFTPAIGWGVLIFYFSLLPGEELPSFLISAKDVLLHFFIYFGLAFLFACGLTQFKPLPISAKSIIIILLFALLMGSTIEVLQESFIPGRHFEWSDIAFNTLGSMAIIPLNLIAKRRLEVVN